MEKRAKREIGAVFLERLEVANQAELQDGLESGWEMRLSTAVPMSPEQSLVSDGFPVSQLESFSYGGNDTSHFSAPRQAACAIPQGAGPPDCRGWLLKPARRTARSGWALLEL